MKTRESNLIAQALILIQRLGRLSADSIWAHKASGIRASLDKYLAQSDAKSLDNKHLENLVRQGFEILLQAANEIPAQDEFC